MLDRKLLPLLLLVSFAVGCGATTSEEPLSQPGPAAVTPPTEVRAVFRFVAERGGAKKEVSSIVYTERFTTRIEGLPKGGEVTLVARMYTPQTKGRGWTSTQVFEADDQGAVDTSTMAPLRGSYEGVDPDGVFWAMTEGPVEEGMWPNRSDAYFEARVGDALVGSASLRRLAMAENIKAEMVTANGLVAEYFAPEGITDRVPVITFGGSEGGIYGGEAYAQQVATMGHPALAVAYFGMKGVPVELEEVPLEYFNKAFAWLDARPELRKGNVVVMGGSRGGELALQLGATFPNVVGVIANTPSSYRWAGLGDGRKAAWTFEGVPLPYVPNSSSLSSIDYLTTPDGRDAWVLRPSFERAMSTVKPADLEAARIAVEKTKGSILMIGGDDDQMWPACDFMKRALDKLIESGHVATYGDESVCIPNAGHDVGSVGLPTANSPWADLGDTTYALGGTPRANAQAGRLAEGRIKAFLARVTK